MPDPGLMLWRITVTGTVLVDRPDGGQTPQEVTVIDGAACEFWPLTGDERLELGQQYATATHRAILYFDPAVLVDPSMTANVADTYRPGRVIGCEIVQRIERPPDDLELLLTERLT